MKTFPLKLWLIASFVAVSIQAGNKIKFNDGDSLETLRDKIHLNGYHFQVDNNWVYDMSPERKGRFLIKRRVPSDAKPIAHTVGPLGARERAAPPTSFDWRDQDGKSYIGAIRDQGDCGACYAFGACAAAEGTYNFATGKTDSACADFSEAYIAFCLGSLSKYSSHFDGCSGSDYELFELTAISESGLYPEYDGVVSESDCPYSESGVNPKDYLGVLNPVKMTSWHRVYPDDYEDTTEYIKEAIHTYGVIDAAVQVGSAFQAYSGGIYEDSLTTPDASPYYYATTNHMVALVGWNDEPDDGEGGYWILRNSWGDSWGESGYMRIRYKSAHVNFGTAYVVYDGGGGTASIAVTSPNGGEVWKPGADQTITWTSSGVEGDVTIELLNSGASAGTIAASATNSGSYSWSIPSSQANGSDYAVKISNSDGSITDVSDATFAITDAATAQLTMSVSPANSGTTTPTGTSTVALGEAQTISATAASGYQFSNWSATEKATLADSTSSTTTVTLIGDATVTALFTQATTMTIHGFDLSLDNSKPNRDSVNVKDAEYPRSAPTRITSARIVFDDASFTCDDTTGEWTEKGGKMTFKSFSNEPKIKMTIDPSWDAWSFQAKKADVNASIDPSDGVEVILSVNDSTVGAATFDYDDLEVKSKVRY